MSIQSSINQALGTALIGLRMTPRGEASIAAGKAEYEANAAKKYSEKMGGETAAALQRSNDFQGRAEEMLGDPNASSGDVGAAFEEADKSKYFASRTAKEAVGAYGDYEAAIEKAARLVPNKRNMAELLRVKGKRYSADYSTEQELKSRYSSTMDVDDRAASRIYEQSQVQNAMEDRGDYIKYMKERAADVEKATGKKPKNTLRLIKEAEKKYYGTDKQ